MTDSGSSTDYPDAGWVVIWTESRAEKRVASRIAAQGIEPWLPAVTERHRWSDRWRDVVLPLFPGYLFARCGPAQVHRLLRTPGVLTVVKAGTKPARLSEDFVVSLRQALEYSGLVAKQVIDKAYVIDDEVIVQEGPLAGLRGVVQQLRGGGRQLVIWVHEIGRGVAFTIGATLVASRPGSGSTCSREITAVGS